MERLRDEYDARCFSRDASLVIVIDFKVFEREAVEDAMMNEACSTEQGFGRLLVELILI